jgi:signal transduction histidine kinase
LEAAYAELQKVERSKDAFISVMSHELQTPLTIAISATEMLEGSPNPQRTHEIVQMLRSGLAREKEVIEDVLLYSTFSSGNLKPRYAEFRLDESLRALVENYRSMWEEKKLSVDLLLNETAAPIRGDSELLQTAFKHLLLNAIRFNTRSGRVRIETKREAGRLEVVFSDTGIGIPAQEQNRIFDRFYQVAEHMTRRVGGLGLGLAIVRRIVEAHGGCVSVSSREGGGSEFRVSLPAAGAASASIVNGRKHRGLRSDRRSTPPIATRDSIYP